MKRKEITEAKNKLRGEVTELLTQIRSVTRVPDRVINGDAIKAAEYKDLVEKVMGKTKCSYQHGTLEDLKIRVETLKTYLSAIQ